MWRSIIDYFIKGFFLANKNLDIYLIGLIFSLPGVLSVLFVDSSVRTPLFYLTLVSTLFSLGFTLSISAFIVERQQHNLLNYQHVFTTTVRNTKRILTPLIVILFLSFILLITLFVLVAMVIHPDKNQVLIFFQNLVNIRKGWNPIFIIPILLFSPFSFTSIFFSVEQNGLLTSLKKSLIVSFKNTHYLIGLIILWTISYSLTSIIPIDSIFGQQLRIMVSFYITLGITASSLLYYQNKVKGL